MSSAALLGSWGRKYVIAHTKSSLPPLHTQGIFITTSDQTFPIFQIFWVVKVHWLFSLPWLTRSISTMSKKGLSQLELPVLLSLLGKFTLKAVPSTVDLGWPRLACAGVELQKNAQRTSVRDSFSEKLGPIYTHYTKTPVQTYRKPLIWYETHFWFIEERLGLKK